MPSVTGGPVANVQAQFSSFVSGQRLVDGGDLAQMASYLFGYNAGVQAGASASTSAAALTVPALTYGMNLTSASVSAGAFVLPNALPGGDVIVQNEGANPVTVWADPSNPNNGGAADTIIPAASATATAASAAVATGRVALFMCFAPGLWKQVLYATS